MTPEIRSVLDSVAERSDVTESYVLLREVRALLDVEAEFFHPEVRIKIYLSHANPAYPYHFEVSHHVHTPPQAGPYFPSRTMFRTETEAVNSAIETTTSFLVSAVRSGLTPENSWLVRNNDF